MEEIQLQIKPITELHPWKDNPRDISPKKFDELKDNLQKHGQREPLLVTDDGTILSGNMRYRAMLELGFDNVIVDTITFVEVDGLWYTMQHNKKQDGQYATKEDAMTEVALGANNRYGVYDPESLENLISRLEIDTSMYSVETEENKTIDELIKSIAPENVEAEFKHQLVVECNNEDEQKALYTQLVGQGYNAKAKTIARKKR